MGTKMFRMLLTRSLSFAAILTAGMTFAFAEPFVDLSVPQTGNFPSVLDLSNGEGGEWGKDDDVESSYKSSPIVGSGAASAATWGAAPKTQFVTGHYRKSGTYVQSYVRSSRR
jgi:hypothetical protein